MRLKRYIINESNQYTIYMDLDGVVVDFLKGISDIIGIQLKNFNDWGKHKKEGWKLVSDKGSGFWSDLEWLRDGKQLWTYIKKYSPSILSAYPVNKNNMDYAIKGKNEWISNNLNGYGNVNLVKGIEKQNYATPTSILIDDSQRNIKQWESKGGIGILHISTKDTIKQLKRLGL